MNAAPSILPTQLDWPSAIGNLLLNFGTLEYFVFCFLKDHLSPEEFVRVKEFHFKDRVKRMAVEMERENFPADQQEKFAQLLVRIEPIRELRNHLAHGHMYFRVDEAAQKPVVTVLKAKDVDSGLMPNADHVEFHEVAKALTELPKLIEIFERLAGFEQTHTMTVNLEPKQSPA